MTDPVTRTDIFLGQPWVITNKQLRLDSLNPMDRLAGTVYGDHTDPLQ
jgi:hypothetical protein